MLLRARSFTRLILSSLMERWQRTGSCTLMELMVWTVLTREKKLDRVPLRGDKQPQAPPRRRREPKSKRHWKGRRPSLNLTSSTKTKRNLMMSMRVTRIHHVSSEMIRNLSEANMSREEQQLGNLPWDNQSRNSLVHFAMTRKSKPRVLLDSKEFEWLAEIQSYFRSHPVRSPICNTIFVTQTKFLLHSFPFIST